MKTKILNKVNEINRKIVEYEDYNFSQLMGGLAGLSLFNCMLFNVSGNYQHKDDAIKLLYKSVTLFNQEPTDDSFGNGLLGIGWLVQQYNSLGIIPDEQTNLLIAIDEIAYNSLDKHYETKNYDLLYGAIGVGRYFLARNEKNNKHVMLNKICDFINTIAVKDKDSIAFPNVFTVERENVNQRGYDFGLAHGTPSVIMFLIDLFKIGINKPLCEELIRGAIRWMMRFQSNNKWQFPCRVIDSDISLEGFRLAWCYGDLCIAIALLNSGKELNDSTIYKSGLDIAIKTVNFKINNAGVAKSMGIYDTGFCHGTSGLAHIYSSLFQLTQEVSFLNAKKYWLNKTLSVDTYKFYEGYDEVINQDIWIESAGLLEGIAGVGCVLLSELNFSNHKLLGKIFQTNN